MVNIDESENCSLSCIRVCVKTKPHVLINDRVKIIIKGQLHWICVKELEAWMPEFTTNKEDDLSLDEESKGNNENDLGLDKENEYDHVYEISFVQENDVEFKKNPNSNEKLSTQKIPSGSIKY
ncbi:hypothetical protein Tco_1204748 [Tanacetum coccineum]